MFSWFRSKPKVSGKEEQLLDAAILEVHPERFFDPLDAALAVQPQLVMLNTLIGRPEEERFFPVTFDDLIQRLRWFEQKGHLAQVIQVAAGDPVTAALVGAALQDGKPFKDQLRPKAEGLVSYLNAHSSTKIQPKRGQ